MLKKRLKSNTIYILFFFCLTNIIAQVENRDYLKYIDSAQIYIGTNPKLSSQFLDSIKQPLNQNIKGNLAEYYKLRGIISDELNNQTLIYHNFRFALKFAKIEKNYEVAGMSSLELFYNLYRNKKDTVKAKAYLEEAKKYYLLDNNKYGLAEVTQMLAYIEFNKGNYLKSNDILLKELDYYKSLKEDKYYQLYALFMLTSNYINLNQIPEAYSSFNQLKTLKNDTTIIKSFYNGHIVTLYQDFAQFYLHKKNLDSVATYLSKAESLRLDMNDSDIRNYFKLKYDYYNTSNQVTNRDAYQDSLRLFKDYQLKKELDASIKINDEFIKTQTELESQTESKKKKNYIIVLLTLMLVGLVGFVIVKFKKIKEKILAHNKNDEELSLLTNNHEKLKLKVSGLNEYIAELKKEIKLISTINSEETQKEKIKELYKNIHLNSSTFLSKEENYLELLNETNVQFFSKMKQLHPNLNESEIVICYYIYVGFKNKEIAGFLNTSTRAIESKRYRISKKIDVKTKQITLLNYLNKTFKTSQNQPI